MIIIMLRVIFVLGGAIAILLIGIFANIAAYNPKYENHWVLTNLTMLTNPALLNERGKRFRKYTLYVLLFLPFWMLVGKIVIWLVEGTWAP